MINVHIYNVYSKKIGFAQFIKMILCTLKHLLCSISTFLCCVSSKMRIFAA